MYTWYREEKYFYEGEMCNYMYAVLHMSFWKNVKSGSVALAFHYVTLVYQVIRCKFISYLKS